MTTTEGMTDIEIRWHFENMLAALKLAQFAFGFGSSATPQQQQEAAEAITAAIIKAEEQSVMSEEERTPREAIIEQIRDMLDDEIGRNFVEAAVTFWSAHLIERSKRKLTLDRHLKEHLALAHLILDNEWDNG